MVDSSLSEADAAASGDAADVPRRRRQWLRVVIGLVTTGVAVTLVWDRIPHMSEVVAAMESASPGWLVLAALAEIVSIRMFARQQRRLLSAFGVSMSLRRAIAVSYARSAIAISLPAGSAVSAGFAFSQFRGRGANASTAATVMILSSLVSACGLALLYLSGGLGAAVAHAVRSGLGAAVLVAAVLVSRLAVLVTWRVQYRMLPAAAVRHPHVAATGKLARVVNPVLEALRAAAGIPGQHWFAALMLAVVNWLADMACLMAVARAFDLSIGVLELAGLYLAVQIVRQLPITPGGIGLIETSLLAGLMAAGTTQASAAAVVLGYRLFSCWLILPLGLAAWAALRHLGRVSVRPRWS